MPREIINEADAQSPNPSQAVMAWGWDLDNGHCAALLDINFQGNGERQGTSIALNWGDLDRLNRATRRAMKHYRKCAASVLPSPE